ncbi:MAG: poly(A) polymerase [Bdellovibrionales bacterium]
MQVKSRPSLTRQWIDPHAFEIVKRLQEADFTTYLVGGCVRDLLAGIPPKDFDIATTAHPEDIRAVIRQAYIIGRRFRLVLVKRDGKQYEVATFRRDPRPEELEDENLSPDNLFGTEEEDAKRRDFTLNSLFYDPVADKLIDYCGGIEDIQNRILRVIGDANTRLKEDPIRILRAIRLTHKLNFLLDSDLRAAIEQNAEGLLRSVLPRKREEILKFLRLKRPVHAFHELNDLSVLQYLSPTFAKVYKTQESSEIFDSYLEQILDLAVNEDHPSELFSALLISYYRAMHDQHPGEAIEPNQILNDEQLKILFRDELGMSNMEQRYFARALHIQSLLRSVHKFKNRGERRQMAVLAQEAFPMALLLCRLDHTLSGSDLLFWEQAYKKALPQIQTLRAETTERPRNRRPRRRPPRRQHV